MKANTDNQHSRFTVVLPNHPPVVVTTDYAVTDSGKLPTAYIRELKQHVLRCENEPIKKRFKYEYYPS